MLSPFVTLLTYDIVSCLYYRNAIVCVRRLLKGANRLPVSRRCSLIVLQIGSNDLYDEKCTVERFIWLLREYIDTIVSRYQLKKVVVMEILHRKIPLRYHINISIEQYNAKVDATNSELQKLHNATYWPHARRLHYLNAGREYWEHRPNIQSKKAKTRRSNDVNLKLQSFNTNITGFPYSYLHVKAKPEPLEKGAVDVVSVKQTASSMLTLCHILPLLLGKHVSVGNAHWMNWLCLLPIVLFCTSTYVHVETDGLLRVLVAEYLYECQRLYPRAPFIKKMHYIIHLPHQTAKYGPVGQWHTWCMWFEGKKWLH